LPDNPPVVRWIRVFLIVLLAALLPVRGVMAAAMLCPQGSHGEFTAGSTDHDHESAALASVVHDQDEAAGADHCAGHGGPEHHGGGCNLCAGCCSVAPLLGAVPKVLEPLAEERTSFPTLSAPAATHQSGGQDRPPRST